MIKEQIAKPILKAIETETGVSIAPADLIRVLDRVPDHMTGHLGFPCFFLSKALKTSPAEVSQRLALALNQTDGITAEAVGPFLNLTFKPAFVRGTLLPFLLDPKFKKGPYLKSPFSQVVIEYSQPNTHKVLHVGHMRNLCMGAAVSNALQVVHGNVRTMTYPGDWGAHIAKSLWYLQKNPGRLQQLRESPDCGEELGAIYTEATLALEAMDPGQAQSELSSVLKSLEARQGETFQLWQETREWSLELMRSSYAWAQVEFDDWIFESEIDEPSKLFVKALKNDGLVVEDQGALGVRLDEEGLGFFMLLKTDGTGLYSTKDVYMACEKVKKDPKSWYIYVVDCRQALHFRQVFATQSRIQKSSKDEAQFTHLSYEMVELPTGAMSSRKGNIVPLSELIAKMEERVLAEFLSSANHQDLPLTSKKNLASVIARGAIKYGMNRFDPQKKIVFDLEEWLKLDGETGPYLQYTGARIKSLLRKAGAESLLEKTQTAQCPSDHLTDEDLKLWLELTLFSQAVSDSAQQLKTHTLCRYLFDLCRQINSFYAKFNLSIEQDEDLKMSRLSLFACTYTVLESGLGILGIEIPDRM